MIHAWWHRFIRKRSQPIDATSARVWKQRLSVAYGILAWNAFGLILYMCYNGKADWANYHGLKTEEEMAVPPGRAWAQTLGIKNATVYRIAGVTKVDEYNIVDGEEKRLPRNNSDNETVQD